MLKHLLTVAAVAAFCIPPALADDTQKKTDSTKDQSSSKDKSDLTGTYTIVSGERDGKPLPKDEIAGSLVTFTKTTILGTDKEKKEFFSATYLIDTSKTPATIAMTSTTPGRDGGTVKMDTAGLIKWDGETVTIVYALPEGKTPTEFKAGEKQHLFVLKETKPASATGKDKNDDK